MPLHWKFICLIRLQDNVICFFFVQFMAKSKDFFLGLKFRFSWQLMVFLFLFFVILRLRKKRPELRFQLNLNIEDEFIVEGFNINKFHEFFVIKSIWFVFLFFRFITTLWIHRVMKAKSSLKSICNREKFSQKPYSIERKKALMLWKLKPEMVHPQPDPTAMDSPIQVSNATINKAINNSRKKHFLNKSFLFLFFLLTLRKQNPH